MSESTDPDAAWFVVQRELDDVRTRVTRLEGRLLPMEQQIHELLNGQLAHGKALTSMQERVGRLFDIATHQSLTLEKTERATTRIEDRIVELIKQIRLLRGDTTDVTPVGG